MKIAYITPNNVNEEALVKEFLAAHKVVFYQQPLGETDGIPEDLRDCDVLSVFVNSRVTAPMIDSMPNLKHLALRSTGYDHVDVAHAKAKGITVSYVPHYGSQTVAEHTFALILALSRKVHAMYSMLQTTGDIAVAEHEGFDLSGKTIGVIGTGAIGKRVCKIARGFNMEVRAFDLFPDQTLAEQLDVKYGTLAEVLSNSHIITLHVPATPENHHLLNAESISLIKHGAYVINTARGSLIDTVALIHALKSGQLAGAGLDVYEGEEFLKDELKLVDSREEFNINVWRAFAAEQELLNMPNVIMTPHMAFNTVEAKREIIMTTVNNILAWAEGREFSAVSI